ncbi:hypothetical protein LCGC14_1758480, partial [marine sediment metagenome]
MPTRRYSVGPAPPVVGVPKSVTDLRVGGTRSTSEVPVNLTRNDIRYIEWRSIVST